MQYISKKEVAKIVGVSVSHVTRLIQQNKIPHIDGKLILEDIQNCSYRNIKHKEWTKDEIQYIKDNYKVKPTKEIALKLDRDEQKIRQKAKKLGLAKPIKNQKHKWTNEEVQFLIDNYQLLSQSQLSEKLNIAKNAINRKACKLKLKKEFKGLSFTEEEFLEVIKNSKNHTEANKKLGYTGNSISKDTRYGQLFNKLKPSISHFQMSSRAKCGEDTSFEAYYNHYKSSTDRRKYGNIEFNLTLDEFKQIIIQKCHYCQNYGTSGNHILKNRKIKLNHQFCGIDRKDNTKGYTVENSLPCCGICNWMKGDYTYEEFLEQMKLIYKNLNLENYTGEIND